ncbi:phosphotransferase [Sphingopyxis sp. XHP0097]|jgi:aminoglycoside/choline kinase family phosphotransferase|uniref:Phosphotransferase n=1 Tax=Sphingopyxis jiangsuensis TaxID=2871171 RepID=A0ABS7MFN4_9SPHN|nr:MULTISPECIES: phosphotransferase [Sphingopyxis]MBL0769052.1 phosphotransferase [Sphingopyxis lutea]MBY4637842.1 phosphotransferase [Sphingopyxis jiangsuensis]
MIPPAHAPAFLAAHGWPDAQILPLAGDASFRRYFRIVAPERCAVLMDAPPPHEDPRPFVAVAEWLGACGLTAPTILARDLDKGLLLIDDFGDVRLRETLDAQPQAEAEHYAGVTDLLVHLHAQPPMAGLPVHGLDEWLDEVMLFTDWYCPALEIEVDRDAFRAAWAEVLGPVERDALPCVTVLRDFHAENIMLVAGKDGLAHYGLLDFQDARVGHPAYDLASVLEDARRDVSPAVEAAMIDRYIAATGQGEAFRAAYWALAAQRNTRILGVFVRLWKRDGKPGYRQFQPRMWGLLERDLAHPALVAVRQWFDANIPAAKRAGAWM